MTENEFQKEMEKIMPEFEIISFLGHTIVHSEPEKWVSRRDLDYVLNELINYASQCADEEENEEEKEIYLERKYTLEVIRSAIEGLWYFEAAHWEIKDFPSKAIDDEEMIDNLIEALD